MNDATPAQNRTLAASEAESGLPADQGAREALVEQIAEALDEHLHVADRNLGQWRTEVTCACGETYVGGQHVGETPLHIARRFHEARAVLPLVEAQVAPLRDEADRLAERVMETERAWSGQLVAKEEAESALRQVREDLTALADEWDEWADWRDDDWADQALYRTHAETLRAVLDSARVGAADTQPDLEREADAPTQVVHELEAADTQPEGGACECGGPATIYGADGGK